MKKSIQLSVLGLLLSAVSFAQVPGQPPNVVPAAEVTHEKVNGKIYMTDGTVHEGIITYNEWDDHVIHYFGTDGATEILKIENYEGMDSLFLEGRGMFHTLKLNKGSDQKALANIQHDGNGFLRYQIFAPRKDIKGNIIRQGDQIQGDYNLFIYHERNGLLYRTNDIKKIHKTISEYIDYCPDVVTKVEKKEKGLKANLLTPDWRVLEKAIEEAENNCPN